MSACRALWLVPLSCVFFSFAPRYAPVAARAARAGTASIDDDKEKDALVRRILTATRAAEMGKQVMKRMGEQLAKMPGLPPGFMDKFMSEVDPNELVDLIVPIYKQHYDLDTLKGVADFYESPMGKKFVAEQPAVLAEAQAAGTKWGQDIAKRVMESMQKEAKDK
jgi:hypothetical protein